MRRRRTGHGHARRAPLRDALAGVTLHVEERGEGFPLLLIQGVGHAKWASQAQWDAYAARRRVLAFDNRGAGFSAKPVGPYSIDLMAGDAASVLDDRDLAQADVYGHSMGGYIALTLAVSRPELVRSLVLVSTGPGGPDHLPLPAETSDVWRSGRRLPLEESVRLTFPTAFAPGWIEEHPAEYAQWLDARLAAPTPPECWRAQFMAAARFRHRGAPVERIDVPTLVVHGDEDRVVPFENGRLLARRLPRAELVVLPGRGHVPMLEAPGELAAIVCDFLDRVDRGL